MNKELTTTSIVTLSHGGRVRVDSQYTSELIPRVFFPVPVSIPAPSDSSTFPLNLPASAHNVHLVTKQHAASIKGPVRGGSRGI